MRLLWKLLRCHLSMAQTVGFTLAGLVGMAIVLTALQAYRDVLPVFDRPDSFMRGDYLVLSKQVGALQAIGLGSSDFTAEELADLRAQPFVREAGAFTPADYRIKGTVGMGGVELSTYLFFESVPDRFLDVGAENWDYKAGDRDIPIIIPRNYLNLYNYGFARSQGLPQISEGIFRRVSLGIEIAGNGHREQFRGRIVGLSNRLNTILVPDAFIRWSNGRFGSGAAKQPARIIVETDRPVDAAVTDYLARKGYEAEGDRRDDGRAARFLRIAAGGVAGVGLVFSAMSFYIQHSVILHPDAEYLPAVAEEQRQNGEPAPAGICPLPCGAALSAADARIESGRAVRGSAGGVAGASLLFALAGRPAGGLPACGIGAYGFVRRCACASAFVVQRGGDPPENQ